MAMLRDNGAVALANMPVTLIVKRPGRQRIHALHPCPAGAPGALYQAIAAAQILASRPLVGDGAYIDPKAPPVGRVEFSVEDFVPEKLKVELALRPADPASRPGQRLRRRRPTSSTARRPRTSRSRPTCASRSTTSPSRISRQYRFGLESERNKFEPPFITLKGADTDDDGQVAPRMGRRPGEGHRPAAARPAPGARLRARRRARHARREDRADAHAQRLSRHPSDLRGPLFARGRRHRVRHRGGRRRGQADRPAGRAVPDRAHRLRLSMVPGRRPLALAGDASTTGCSPPTRWRSRPTSRRACRGS